MGIHHVRTLPYHPACNGHIERVVKGGGSGHDVQSKTKSYSAGDSVFASDYGQGPKGLPGMVIETEGSVLLRVRLTDGWINVDQLR